MNKNIYDLKIEEIENILVKNGIAKFKAKQIWNWLYVNLVSDYDEMNNVDKRTIEVLKNEIYFPRLENVVHLTDNSDRSEKALLRLSDKNTIETVLMKQRYGYSICVTSQIGCAVGCSFCASGLLGFNRNLLAGEIVLQAVFWQRYLKKLNARVSQVVIMGIGEPFNNYDNVIKFVDIINSNKGLNIGARHITVSTSGIVTGIDKLAEYDKQINLAISLHASNDSVRDSIMKINKAYPITDIMSSVEQYIDKTNRRVTFEYIMLKGINDKSEHAKELSRLLRTMNCHVNLISYNKVDGLDYEKSNLIEEFANILMKNKINVTIRKSLGEKIDGACGQLRHKEEKR